MRDRVVGSLDLGCIRVQPMGRGDPGSPLDDDAMPPQKCLRRLSARVVWGALCATACSLPGVPLAAQGRVAAALTTAEVTAAAADDEWRDLDPEYTVYMELEGGRVVMELAPEFAPRHVENVRALVRGGYFDGGAVTRSQDNYVVQWARRSLDEGQALPDGIHGALPAEFEVAARGLPFTPIPDGDVYAPEAGFVRGFPSGRDPQTGTLWMAHCYGVVGVPRGNDPESGSGQGLYAVIGHAPRHLDRNLSMVGRVVAGMEHLSTLPRGTESLGRYESRDEWVTIESVRLESDVPVVERTPLQVLRTDSRSFSDLILAARSRHEQFFVYPTHRIDLCNVPVPTRIVASEPSGSG
ncbi:MAG: peptidylprolyl isomerase, partial [Gemmatimonadota bacterium]|nr:peptidylprolyl isomerase [Gemmatimonadota bacterium]